eukprot:1438136-Pyramimonas_sp.AAC.1
MVRSRSRKARVLAQAAWAPSLATLLRRGLRRCRTTRTCVLIFGIGLGFRPTTPTTCQCPMSTEWQRQQPPAATTTSLSPWGYFAAYHRAAVLKRVETGCGCFEGGASPRA